MKLEIYTDGSATVKTKPGGYAWVLVVNGTKHSEGNGHMPLASNNDAELEAAIQGLASTYRLIHGPNTPIEPLGQYSLTLVSDSQIVLNWASGKNQFKQLDKMHKFNQLKMLMQRMAVNIRWVEGHSGDEHNERCDELANMARLQTTEKLKKSKKEPKNFRWSDSDKQRLENIKYGDQVPIDVLLRVVLGLVELEESRRK